MYFKLHDNFFQEDKPKTVTIQLVWYDVQAGSSWKLVYDAGEPTMKTAFSITGTGDRQWHDNTVTLTDAVMDHGGTRGSDIALVNTDDKDDVFSILEVHRGVPQALPANNKPATDRETVKSGRKVRRVPPEK